VTCRAGMTLVEVLIAMAIFIFGVTAVLGLFQLGGGLEARARVEAELAPALEPLIRTLRESSWRQNDKGDWLPPAPPSGDVVPGAPDYRYDLVVYPGPADRPDLVRAQLRFWRTAPDRVLAQSSFLLPRRIPVDRRLQSRP
jgi:prepilin-type N-terminal cleavage/methylation domain-containing protein